MSNIRIACNILVILAEMLYILSLVSKLSQKVGNSNSNGVVLNNILSCPDYIAAVLSVNVLVS